MNAQERLDAVVELLGNLPIRSAASDYEPWAKINLVDLTAVTNVASGQDDPSDWVHEACGREYPEGHRYEHSPHHWSEYRAGRTPLRIPHWCDGSVE